jgi:hypothetical protein
VPGYVRSRWRAAAGSGAGPVARDLWDRGRVLRAVPDRGPRPGTGRGTLLRRETRRATVVGLARGRIYPHGSDVFTTSAAFAPAGRARLTSPGGPVH